MLREGKSLVAVNPLSFTCNNRRGFAAVELCAQNRIFEYLLSEPVFHLQKRLFCGRTVGSVQTGRGRSFPTSGRFPLEDDPEVAGPARRSDRFFRVGIRRLLFSWLIIV
jgi:hypothetical protein